jgi:hypothetical protein
MKQNEGHESPVWVWGDGNAYTLDFLGLFLAKHFIRRGVEVGQRQLAANHCHQMQKKTTATPRAPASDDEKIFC